jgi:transposase
MPDHLLPAAQARALVLTGPDDLRARFARHTPVALVAGLASLRDLTRYRRTLVQERTREKQRAEKLLEDAQVKLSSVISDIFGVSGRDTLGALIAGQRDPHALADLARKKMRTKMSVLQEALTGHFTDHHAFLLGMRLSRVDALTDQIDTLTIRIQEAIAPFGAQIAQLDEIPGIGVTAAQEIIAEVGTGISRFRSGCTTAQPTSLFVVSPAPASRGPAIGAGQPARRRGETDWVTVNRDHEIGWHNNLSGACLITFRRWVPAPGRGASRDRQAPGCAATVS